MLAAWSVGVVRWVQMWAPAIATVVVIGLAVAGVALVSAIDFFRRVFGEKADSDGTPGLEPSEDR